MCFCLKRLWICLIKEHSLSCWNDLTHCHLMYSQSNNLESVGGDSCLWEPYQPSHDSGVYKSQNVLQGCSDNDTLNQLNHVPCGKLIWFEESYNYQCVYELLLFNFFQYKYYGSGSLPDSALAWKHHKTSVFLLIFFLCRCISTARWQTHPNC